MVGQVLSWPGSGPCSGIAARQIWPVWPLTLSGCLVFSSGTTAKQESGQGSQESAPSRAVSTNHPVSPVTNQVFLRNTAVGLTNFYAALADLEAGKRRHVRILHYGDSMLWHENTARRIRELLQKRFGDGGRGFVYLHHGDFGVNLEGHQTSGDSFPLNTIPFELFNHKEPKWLDGLGFSGMSWFSPTPAALSRQRMTGTKGAPWTEVELFLRPRGYQEGRNQSVVVSGTVVGSNQTFTTNHVFLWRTVFEPIVSGFPTRDIQFPFPIP